MEVSDNNGPGVSFHIPLHRLITQFIHTLITTWPNQLPLPSILAMVGKPKAVNTFAAVLLDGMRDRERRFSILAATGLA